MKTKTILPFASERLTYRDFTESDSGRIQEIAVTPGFAFILFEKLDELEGERFIEKCRNDAKTVSPVNGARNDFKFAVCLNERGGDVIGYIGLFDIDYEKRDGEIGYFIDPREQKKGYAREATEAIMRFGREHLALTEFYATAREDNSASHKVLEACGFKWTGTVPNKYNDDAGIRRLYRKS